MAFAKLSSALLVCDRPVVAVAPAPLPQTISIRPVQPVRPNVEDRKSLAQNLKTLRLTRFLGEFDQVARQCAAEGHDHYRYLLRLSELELTERKRRSALRRVKSAGFPTDKSLESFDVRALPQHLWGALLGLAECGYIERHENIIAIGNSGTGKTHLAIGLGMAACEKSLSVRFTSAASLVQELLEARREHRLARLYRQLIGYKLLVIDDLGYVTLPAEGAELLFDVLSQRCERGSTLITTNLPTTEWMRVFGAEHLTGALVDRLTYRAHLLDMSGDSYRLRPRPRLI